MKINIMDKESKLIVGQGDLIHDEVSNIIYIITYDDYPDKHIRYKLVALDGSGNVFNNKNYTVDDIKDLISKGGLVHYSKSKYNLDLIKVEE